MALIEEGFYKQQPYVRFGEGDELLFLPGLTDGFSKPQTQKRQLLKQLEKVAETFRVTVLGRRRPVPPSMQEMAADVADYISDHEVGYLAGISMGGMVLQHLFRHELQRVRGALLMATGARQQGFSRTIIQEMQTALQRRDYLQLQTHAYRLIYGSFPPGLKPAANPPEDVEDFMNSSSACLKHHFAGLGRVPLFGVTILGGAKDPGYPPELVQELADRVGSARVRIEKNAGHGLMGALKTAMNEELHRLREDYEGRHL